MSMKVIYIDLFSYFNLKPNLKILHTLIIKDGNLFLTGFLEHAALAVSK